MPVLCLFSRASLCGQDHPSGVESCVFGNQGFRSCLASPRAMQGPPLRGEVRLAVRRWYGTPGLNLPDSMSKWYHGKRSNSRALQPRSGGERLAKMCYAQHTIRGCSEARTPPRTSIWKDACAPEVREKFSRQPLDIPVRAALQRFSRTSGARHCYVLPVRWFRACRAPPPACMLRITHFRFLIEPPAAGNGGAGGRQADHTGIAHEAVS